MGGCNILKPQEELYMKVRKKNNLTHGSAVARSGI